MNANLFPLRRCPWLVVLLLCAGCTDSTEGIDKRIESFVVANPSMERDALVKAFQLQKIESTRTLSGMRGGYHRLAERWHLDAKNVLEGVVLVKGKTVPQDVVDDSGSFIDYPFGKTPPPEPDPPSHFDKLLHIVIDKDEKVVKRWHE